MQVNIALSCRMLTRLSERPRFGLSQRHRPSIRRSFARSTCCCSPQASRTAAKPEPAEVFQRSGCVGNIVQAGASLQTGDLQKNGAASTDAIYKLIYSGKGKMPGYGKECTPRGKCTFGPRLPDEDVQRLSQYVLDQAAVKWK